MQRAPALQPLSRRHRDVLVCARALFWRADRLTHGRPDPNSRAVADLIAFADGPLPAHFAAENDILLAALRSHPRASDEDRALCDTFVATQTAILAAVDALRAGPDNDLALLDRAVEALREHVRVAEHELFPAAERLLGESGLEEVASRLHARVV